MERRCRQGWQPVRQASWRLCDVWYLLTSIPKHFACLVREDDRMASVSVHADGTYILIPPY